MNRRTYTIGEVFGQWTITGTDRTDTSGTVWVHARCTCGTERSLRAWTLHKGKSKRCADCSAKHLSKLQRDAQAQRLLGSRVGTWTVVQASERLPLGVKDVQMWTCRCTCGTVIDIPQRNLTSRTAPPPVCYHGQPPAAA